MAEPPALNESSLSCFGQGTEGDLAQCVTEGAFAAGPSPALVGLLIAGVLLSTLYIAGDGSIVTPAVATILFGGALVPLLPPQFVTLAYTVVVIGITAAAFAAYQRFATRGF
jgi:hypothetical protein